MADVTRPDPVPSPPSLLEARDGQDAGEPVRPRLLGEGRRIGVPARCQTVARG